MKNHMGADLHAREISQFVRRIVRNRYHSLWVAS
jgi:hypothetical protein